MIYIHIDSHVLVMQTWIEIFYDNIYSSKHVQGPWVRALLLDLCRYSSRLYLSSMRLLDSYCVYVLFVVIIVIALFFVSVCIVNVKVLVKFVLISSNGMSCIAL